MPLPDRLEFRIDLPADSGFLGRQCNSPGCKKYFKVHAEDIKDRMHCPYCGEEFANNELWTEDQLNYIKDRVAQEVMPLVQKNLADMFERAFSGSKNMRFERGRPTIPPDPVPPAERKVDSQLTCPNCSMRFQVDGIFCYCPRCRAENLLI
jgi:hypothetical protein